MKILNQILQPVKKFSKGMFALLTLNLLVVLCVFIFDSCKKAAYERSDAKQANEKFTAALEKNKKSLAAISFAKQGSHGTIARSAAPPSDELTVYVQFPDEVTPEENTLLQNTNSMQAVVDLIHETDAIIQYEPTPTNTDYQINLPIETITNSLNPLVQESKQYLYSKGFSEQEIQQMIIEENAEDYDLIPLVMSLTQIENSQQVARNYFNLLPLRSSYAKELTWSDVGACAMEAVGADILYALTQSTASTWSKAAIKKAFGTVAKKVLGPVGVAVAVVEFGWCLWRKS